MNDNHNVETSTSQTKKILEFMRKGGKITPLEALYKFHCFRLGARIKDIEAIIGYPPKRERVKVKNAEGQEVWVMQYFL